MKIYLTLSFDHELPLGGLRDSYEEALFKPTEKIMALADECQVPISLFTDVLSGIQFKKWGDTAFSERYETQIQQTLQRKQEVQLHLHPHWLQTTYEAGTFHPHYPDGYVLHDYRNEPYPNNIEGIVDQGVDFLNQICKAADPDYQCIAFRAGGYALSPSTDKILAALYKRGIRIDSSIAKGYRFESLSFTGMPQSANWHIPKTGPLTAAVPDGIFEVPIVSTPRTPVNNILPLIKRFIYRHREQQHGISLPDAHVHPFEKLKRLFPISVWMLSFDRYYESAESLIQMLASYVKAHETQEVIYASLISHPKFMGTYQFRLMRDFIDLGRKTYKDHLIFCHYKDIFSQIHPTDQNGA